MRPNMRHHLVPLFALALPLSLAAPALAEEYVPPPAAQVPGYYAEVLPCKITREDRTRVECKDGFLGTKTLRELSILRNTIYARYGWSGFRKPWLRDYFNSQPWYKPNPKFTYKMMADADKKNGHLIAVFEQSLTERELFRMRADVYARRGKVWNDAPEWTLKGGKKVRACEEPKDVDPEAESVEYMVEASNDCHYRGFKWYKPNKAYTDALLTREDRIELGLIARSLGSFALDDESREKQSDSALDRVLKVDELRQLSLRDLRVLRNTIYARRGRTFKSQILRDHFAGMSWYKVNPAYTDKLLTKNDQRNISLIKSVENEFGGPLSDEDWLTEPAVDGA